MNIVFAGTPEFAVPPLEKLASRHKIVAVLTQPDRKQGRKGLLTPPPVKCAAQKFDFPVLQPENLKRDHSMLQNIKADLMVTCAFGQILPKEVLDLYPLGVYNIHASLLPAYRGAAPIARAIMDGLKETGITIMKTDVGLDTGEILLQRKAEILASDTAKSLEARLSCLGADCISEALDQIEAGTAAFTKQGEGFVCKKVQRSDVDFSWDADRVSCFIRALSPAPLAFSSLCGTELNFYFAESVDCGEDVPFGTVVCASPKEGLIVKCGTDAVKITELQAAGGKCMSARDFLNGRKIQKGQRFDQSLL